MLSFFKNKSKGIIIYSPCKGKVVPITEVPDPTFSEKILGDGFAVIPSDGKIYAPADGEITAEGTKDEILPRLLNGNMSCMHKGGCIHG